METVQESAQVGDITRRRQIALAWGAIVILATPRILLRLFVPAASGEPLTPYWLAWTQVVVLAALWVVTWVWPTIKPLRGFVLALLAYCVGGFLIIPFVEERAAWSNWMQRASFGVWLVADRLLDHLVLVGLMALTMIGSGIGRRELFLVRGNPGAPVQPTRLLLVKEPEPWTRFARNFVLVFAIIVAIVVGIQVRPKLSQITQALIYLPSIILAAAINAFGEEFEFRSIPLARLVPGFGPQQAILMVAGLFGLLHYFGWPGGLAGVLLAAYLGLVAAKSMVETRGFVWAFLIHFVGDAIVYTFWAMSAA